MRPQITVDLEHYNSLIEDAEAFRKIKRDDKFINFTIHSWSFLSGRVEVTTNDERVEKIRQGLIEDFETFKSYERLKSHPALTPAPKVGFFKRLFS